MCLSSTAVWTETRVKTINGRSLTNKVSELHSEESKKDDIRLQHFAECSDEKEEARTSLFLNGLLCTYPFTPGHSPAKHKGAKLVLTAV